MTCRSGTVTGGGWQFLALFRGKDYGEIVEAERGEVVDTSQPWAKQGAHGQFSVSGLHTSAEHEKGRHGCMAVAMDVWWLPWMYGSLQERSYEEAGPSVPQQPPLFMLVPHVQGLFPSPGSLL